MSHDDVVASKASCEFLYALHYIMQSMFLSTMSVLYMRVQSSAIAYHS